MPAVSLGASEVIIVDITSTFDNTITLNGAGAGFTIVASQTVTTTNDTVTVTLDKQHDFNVARQIAYRI